MLAVLTVRGLTILRKGTAAPLWRLIVTPENTLWLGLVSALVVAFCFAYAVRKFVFSGAKGAGRLTGPWQKLIYVFVAVPFFVIPELVDQIITLSPFYFALMPSAIALALTASQVDPPKRRLVSGNLRFFLIGLFAAIGVWEGVSGILLAIVIFVLSFRKKIRCGRTATRVLILWVAGFLLGFLGEGACLGWPWSAIRPLYPPIVGLTVFLFVAIAPVAVVRVLGTRWWLMLVWGLVLGVLTVNVLVEGRYWREGASEGFVRKVLADLGERKLIIGDGLLDILVEELKPADVRLLGSRSLADREFLVNNFDDDEPVSRRALVVRHYYYLPETEAMMSELGYRWRKPAETAKDAGNAKDAKEKAVTASKEAMKARVAMYALGRAIAATPPVLKSIKDMTEEYEKIPAAQRRKKIEEARENIRRGWDSGLEGTGLSATILALDTVLGDWAAAESDALIALMIDREDPAANTMLGNLRLRARRFVEAEKYLRKGVKGGGSAAYNDLALVLLRTDRAKEALEWARKAVAKAPKDWNCRETLVQVLIALEETLEAQKELSEVERLAKEQKRYELIKEAANRDRTEIMRQRGRFANEQWGQDKSDRWGE